MNREQITTQAEVNNAIECRAAVRDKAMTSTPFYSQQPGVVLCQRDECHSTSPDSTQGCATHIHRVALVYLLAQSETECGMNRVRANSRAAVELQVCPRGMPTSLESLSLFIRASLECVIRSKADIARQHQELNA